MTKYNVLAIGTGIEGDISLNWHELHKYMLRFTESIPPEREIK